MKFKAIFAIGATILLIAVTACLAALTVGSYDQTLSDIGRIAVFQIIMLVGLAFIVVVIISNLVIKLKTLQAEKEERELEKEVEEDVFCDAIVIRKDSYGEVSDAWLFKEVSVSTNSGLEATTYIHAKDGILLLQIPSSEISIEARNAGSDESKKLFEGYVEYHQVVDAYSYEEHKRDVRKAQPLGSGNI